MKFPRIILAVLGLSALAGCVAVPYSSPYQYSYPYNDEQVYRSYPSYNYVPGPWLYPGVVIGRHWGGHRHGHGGGWRR